MTEVLKGLADALIRMPQMPSDQLADLLGSTHDWWASSPANLKSSMT